MKTSTLIREFVAQAKPGWVFTPSDLAAFGSPYAIGMTLTRMVKAGEIDRVARGFYNVPAIDPLLGKLAPSAGAVIEALVRRDGVIVRPAGATAANRLRLTEQVPAHAVYDTDGASRRIMLGRQVLELRHRAGRALRNVSADSYALISALENLGRIHVSLDRVRGLRGRIPDEARRGLLRDVQYAPSWMRPAILFVADAPVTEIKAPAAPHHTTTQDGGALDELVRRLVHAHNPWRLYLFGSRTRGEVAADSDYDLMMVLETVDGPAHRIAQAAHAQTWGLGISVDILVMSRKEFETRLSLKASLPATVVREGRLLHAGTPLLSVGRAKRKEQV